MQDDNGVMGQDSMRCKIIPLKSKSKLTAPYMSRQEIKRTFDKNKKLKKINSHFKNLSHDYSHMKKNKRETGI